MNPNDQNESLFEKQAVQAEKIETGKNYTLDPGYSYHVFLSHNSKDKPEIQRLKQELESKGIICWYDEDELQPGMNILPLLERGIRESQSVIVAFGASGLGPWENEEMQSALQLAVREKRPVIPLLLPGAPKEPELPLFLANRKWVDLREEQENGIGKLIWGITGQQVTENGIGKPNEPTSSPPTDTKKNTLVLNLPAQSPAQGIQVSGSCTLTICLLAAFFLFVPFLYLFKPPPKTVFEQWNLEKDLATPIATELHDEKRVKQAQLYVGKKGKFTFALTSSASQTFVGRSFHIPFSTEPTSITIEVNINGQFDTSKFEAFDGSVVNVLGTVSKIEKVSDVRATIDLEGAEFTDLPKNP